MNRKPLDPELSRQWYEFKAQAEPPEWIRRMIDDCWTTGTYRWEDYIRLVGDPTKGVEIGPDVDLASVFGVKKEDTPPWG